MSRNLLHKSKLEAFKAWLVEQDIPFRPGKGEWQELQVRLPNSTVYAAVYSRADMPEHLSVDRRLDSLVKRFCQHKPPTVGNPAMTTNKLEVVAWYTPATRYTLPVVALDDRSQRGEPLIRLSDYQKLQDEYNALEASEYRKWLGEILAIIHRDGGHYQLEHGTAKAVADAEATIYKMLAENDVLVEGIELLLKRLEKMPHKLWIKEQLGAILAELATTNKGTRT